MWSRSSDIVHVRLVKTSSKARFCRSGLAIGRPLFATLGVFNPGSGLVIYETSVMCESVKSECAINPRSKR